MRAARADLAAIYRPGRFVCDNDIMAEEDERKKSDKILTVQLCSFLSAATGFLQFCLERFKAFLAGRFHTIDQIRGAA